MSLGLEWFSALVYLSIALVGLSPLVLLLFLAIDWRKKQLW